MKNLSILSISFCLVLFSACEDQVDLNLDSVEPFLAVEAFLTNQPGTQQVLLTYTQSYFDNTRPSSVSDAEVQVIEQETGTVYDFEYNETKKVYEWVSTGEDDAFGVVGYSYLLRISHDGVTYTATSTINEVPSIDSITFEYYPADAFITEDYYIGEFWARDLEGVGDTYWIKTWRNGVYFNHPSEIVLSYDAGGGVGAVVDGEIFMLPVRTGINAFENDENDQFIPPYAPAEKYPIRNDSVFFENDEFGYIREDTLIFNDTRLNEDTKYALLDGDPYSVDADTLIKRGDSVRVELHAVTNETFFFLSRVANETNRPGGFGELFADPLGSIPTNIIPSDENVKVVGFFNTAAVSSFGATVSEQTIRDNVPD